MRVNEYNNLEEFYEEYVEGRRASTKDRRRGFMGIEFKYHGEYYRMCREPLMISSHEAPGPILEDGRVGLYDVMRIKCDETGTPIVEYDLIGWYADLDDVLDNCYIQGKPFREVIMADETLIIGQD